MSNKSWIIMDSYNFPVIIDGCVISHLICIDYIVHMSFACKFVISAQYHMSGHLASNDKITLSSIVSHSKALALATTRINSCCGQGL